MPAAPLEFRIFNPDIREAVERFREFLIERVRAGRSVRVQEILDGLPFQMGGTTREDLLTRGPLDVRSETELGNEGPEFFGTFTDSKLGDIAVYFPETVRAEFQASPQTIAVQFPEPVECVLYILPTLLGSLRRSAYQYLHSLVAGPGYWQYYLTTQNNRDEALNLVIDLTGADFSPSRYGYELPLIVRRKRALAPCCPFDKGAEVRDLRTRGRTLPIHFRRIVEPSSHAIDELIAALNRVFQDSQVPITAEIRTNRQVTEPTLEVVDVVVGDNTSPTEEQNRLFRLREGVPDGEICFYVIRQMSVINGEDPGIAGRALIGGPSGMVEADAPLYIFAHETCHTLGLGHNAVEGSLMFPSVDSSRVPLLQPNERTAVLSSPFLR